MIWITLGIEKTKDKRAITRAYREKLSVTNPEEKPEEFKALRSAYEQALEYANAPEEQASKPQDMTNQEKTPVEIWSEELNHVYMDFRLRRDVEAWKNLLSADVCYGLDTRPQAEEALIQYLMQHYFISQKVWQILDDNFELTSRYDELCEKYPKDFVDYIIVRGPRYEERLPVALFTPGEDGEACDAYWRYFSEMKGDNPEEAEAIWNRMEQLPESHPYGTLLIARIRAYYGDESQMAIVADLAAAYPQDLNIQIGYGGELHRNHQYREAVEIARRVLDADPRQQKAMLLLSDCLSEMGEYKEAADLLDDIMRLSEGDQTVYYDLKEKRDKLNEALIEQYQQTLKEKENDSETLYELIWCYIENNRDEEALPWMEKLDPDTMDPYKYHHVMAAVLDDLHRDEEALQHIEELIAVIEGLTPDGTEETEKRINRYSDMLLRRAGLLLRLDRGAEAMEEIGRAIQSGAEKAATYNYATQIAYGCKEYAKAAEYAAAFVRFAPDTSIAYYFLARAQRAMGMGQQAYNAIQRALDLDGSQLPYYTLKLWILLQHNAYDAAKQMIDFLHQNGINDDLTLRWSELSLQLNQLDGSDPEAYDKLMDAYIRLDQEEGEDSPAQYEWNEEYLQELAWLYKRCKQEEKSIEVYTKLLEFKRNNTYVERQLADLYRRNLAKNADKALHYYQIGLAEKDDPVSRFYAGRAAFLLGDLEEAELHFMKEQELDPDDVDAPIQMAYIRLRQNRAEEALEHGMRAIEIARELQKPAYYMWRPAVFALRRLNRVREAIDLLHECQNYDKDFSGCEEIYETCRQVADWDGAAKALADWKKNPQEAADWSEKLILLQILQKNFEQARKELKVCEKNLTKKDHANICYLLKPNRKNILALAECYASLVKESEKRGEKPSAFVLNSAAEYYWMAGKKQEAEAMAARGLARLEEILKTNLENRILYRSKEVVPLAILGRLDEAREAVEECRSMQLCPVCSYSSCKDNYIYEIFLEIVAGNKEKALKMCEEGERIWPDDTDFIGYERYLNYTEKEFLGGLLKAVRK